MPLSATTVSQAKPRPKQYKLWDERGLFLIVTPEGSRYWRFNYRLAGKARTISLGVYPDVTLADARIRRDEARRLVAAGEDPSAEKKRGVAALRLRFEGTFDMLADEYIERLQLQGRTESTIGKNKWLLDHARPLLGKRVIGDASAA